MLRRTACPQVFFATVVKGCRRNEHCVAPPAVCRPCGEVQVFFCVLKKADTRVSSPFFLLSLSVCSLALPSRALSRTLRLFAAVPQQRRLLQRGVGSNRQGAGNGEETFKGEAFFFLPMRLNGFVSRAERLQERMMQGTGKACLPSFLVRT